MQPYPVSSILPSECLALWLFLRVMAEGNDALGPSYPLSLDVPLETAMISELTPRYGWGHLTSPRAQTWALPINNPQPSSIVK